jgi:hypothetical protein
MVDLTFWLKNKIGEIKIFLAKRMMPFYNNLVVAA